MTSKLTPLPAECAAEIAELQPFASHTAAVTAIDHGLRKRYMDRLYQHGAAERCSDRLVHDVAAAINLAFDRAMALTLPAGGGCHPIDCLTDAERAALGT